MDYAVLSHGYPARKQGIKMGLLDRLFHRETGPAADSGHRIPPAPEVSGEQEAANRKLMEEEMLESRKKRETGTGGS